MSHRARLKTMGAGNFLNASAQASCLALALLASGCGGSLDEADVRSGADVVGTAEASSGLATRMAVSAVNACSSPANAVVAENCLPGSPSSEWDVFNDGDSTILGFPTDISFNRGQAATFKIKTDARGYRIDVYRLGYYGGLGARKVATVVPSVSLPQNQPACLSDNSTGLVDCGNWTVSASWNVPVNAVSGVYIAKLTRTDTGGSSHIRFVVRDDASRSDLVVQTSDTTWQAYNTYGGNSLYAGGPAPWGAYKVSYNRPLLGRGDPYHGFFVNEYPMIRWLEANGFDVSYTTGVDSDRRGSLIRNHKLFLSVGHDEYWSGVQRANVEAARDQGVHLAFFSGNSIYWKTRWEPSIDGTGSQYRTLVSYKETRANAKIDPSPEWTGTWRDPRFSPPADGGRPENALQGTFWLVNCCNSSVTQNYSVQVDEEAGKLRFWRNTALQNLAPGQKATLTPGLLGFEWDTDIDNGFRPRGLFRLSEATYDVPEKMLDYGSTVGPGTVTHYLTLYRHTSGALVFGAGTTRWSWGLDDEHDGSGTPVDPRVRQATVNLFADMGVQPGSLQPGISPASQSIDSVPPSAQFTQPAAGASVPGDKVISVVGTASDLGGGRVAGVEVSVDGGSTWVAARGRTNWTFAWAPNAIGSATILARAIDDSGNVQASPTALTVAIEQPACPCSIFKPADVPAIASAQDGDAVELGVKFKVISAGHVTGIRFFKGTQNTGTHIGNLWTAEGRLLASATFVAETASGWQQVNFVTPVYVKPGTTYVASYFAPRGGYSITSAYFSAQINSSPFQLPGGAEGNGVYAYGSASRFPTNSYQSANYWVDVVFASTSVVAEGDSFVGTSGQSLAVAAPGVLANDTDSGGRVLTASVVTPPQFGSISLSPDGSFLYAPQPGFFGTDSFVYAATSTNGQQATAVVDIKYQQSGCPCTLFPSTAIPAVTSFPDVAVELGVKFMPTTRGFVTGVRFYKGPGNTGTHTGSLWRTDGTLLARAVFRSETAIGWQTADFDRPVEVLPGVTYVASYFAPNGGYAFTGDYFHTALDSQFLIAPAAAGVGGNGVFAYSNNGTSVFPGNSYRAGNYWVDVLFSPVLAVNDEYVARASEFLAVSNGGVLANDLDGTGGTLSSVLVAGPSSGVLGLSPDGSFTYQPNPGFVGTDSFSYRAVSSSGQGAIATARIDVVSASAVYTLFANELPSIASVPDGGVELGLKFTPRVAGSALGVRFYKGTGNTGTHVGNLWTSSGQLLATAVFAGETATGWQEVRFTTPVPLTPGTLYVVSYFAPSGGYAFSGAYFTAPLETPVMSAPSADQVGGNGVFAYGSSSRFPTDTWQAGNYWVDVTFQPQP